MIVTVIKDGKETQYIYYPEHMVKAVEFYNGLQRNGEIDSFYFEVV